MDWIIDTDMGLDDQISLLYLAEIANKAGNNFNIKAVLTQGTGLAHAEAAKANAVRLLRFAGISAKNLPPVGIGVQETLDGFHQYNPSWRYQEDNLRGAILPSYAKEVENQNKTSSALLEKILSSSTQKVSILELGTYSTIAQVLSVNPALANKVERIVSMIGAVDAVGNISGGLDADGNEIHIDNKVAEFNAWIDPVAAKAVFASGIPITMVSLDVTQDAPLTQDFVNRFRASTQGRVANLLVNWWEGNIKNPVGEYFHWDPLATVLAFNPDLITRQEDLKISVNADPTLPGQPVSVPIGAIEDFSLLNWQGARRSSLDSLYSGQTKRDENGKLVNVVFDADIAGFEDNLIAAFSRKPFKLAFFGDGGTEVVQGTTFYHDIGGYSDNNKEKFKGEFAAAGPSVQAVSRYIHSQAPSDVIELGGLSYNSNASTLLDINVGKHYNSFMYPYPSPLYVDAEGVYAKQVLGGAPAKAGRTQWPYNLYNYPSGYPDSADGIGTGGSVDRNRFWFPFGNHDYSSFLGDADPNINYLEEESIDMVIKGGAPIGPDVYQAKAVSENKGQHYGNTLQQLFDYFPWLSENIEQQLRYLGINQAALSDVSINVGRLDPNGVDGAYYSVSLGDDGLGNPLVHLQFIDSTRLLTNAGYYDFYPSGANPEPIQDPDPDYAYDPANPSSKSNFNPGNQFQGQQMLEWSKQDFAASSARWQVISPHHTTYGPAATFDKLSTNQYNSNPVLISYISSLNRYVQELNPDNGIDFIINGDSHYYSRILEQAIAPGGIGLGIPVITLGNGGIRPATINLIPYGTEVNNPANKANFDANNNGDAKLNPTTPGGIGMPGTRPVSAGASGYYSYSRINKAPQGAVTTEKRTLGGIEYEFKIPVYNYNATAEDSDYQGNTGTDVSGLYGYGQGAAIAEADADYFLIRYQTVEVLDPAIVSLAPAGVETSRGSSFYKDWSPSTAKLNDLAIFSFNIDEFGRVSSATLGQGGRGYFSNAGGSADVIYSIPGANPQSPGKSHAKVRLVFSSGSLQSVELIDGGSGYNLVANGINQQNGSINSLAPAGSTNSPVAGILIGLNIELEEQYTLAAKAPDDQPLYSDWYLQAVTESTIRSSAASATSAYGAIDLLIQPKSSRAREILDPNNPESIPLTTGYSGVGQQQAFSLPQIGSVLLFDRNGQTVSNPSAGQVRNGVAQLALSALPAPGPLSARFEGDPMSSYLVNFRPSTTAVDVNLGSWSSNVAAIDDGGSLAIAFGQGGLVSAVRGDAGSGLVDFSLIRASGLEAPVEAPLLQNAASSAANVLTMDRLFREGQPGWLGTEGNAMGASSSSSTFITAGAWRPVAKRNGLDLKLKGLNVVGNAIQADFDGDIRALLTLSGSGSTDQVTGLSLTVRRLGSKNNGLAFYEADLVTGALLSGPGKGLLPGQAGYSSAAFQQAELSGLVLRSNELPGYSQQKVFTDIPLHSDRNYGVLLLVDDNPGSLLSSYASANPGGLAQFVAFAAEGRGISYGIEDIAVSSGFSDRDFNDLSITLTSNAPILLA
jgi:inosine-uridine nucleoside N-ribohydrolase